MVRRVKCITIDNGAKQGVTETGNKLHTGQKETWRTRQNWERSLLREKVDVGGSYECFSALSSTTSAWCSQCSRSFAVIIRARANNESGS